MSEWSPRITVTPVPVSRVCMAERRAGNRELSGAQDTVLYGINNHSVAIGYYDNGTTNHSVTYTISTRTRTALPDISGYSQNDAYCINDLGFAVGNAFEGSSSVA